VPSERDGHFVNFERVTKSTAGLITLAVWGIVAALLTLTPQEIVSRLPPLLCLWCGDYPAVDLVLNVLLFLPLGVGLVMVVGCREWTAYAGVMVSAVIELLQFIAVPGRDASLNDLLANGLGGAAGAALACHFLTLLAPAPALARRLAIGALGVCAGMGVLVPWLLQPTIQQQPHYVQWQQQKGGYATFGGTLERLWLNSTELRDGERIPPEIPPWSLSPRAMRVAAEARDTSGRAATRRVAIIARLASVDQEAFLLGRSGDAAVFRSRMRAMTVGLREPMVGVSGAFGPGRSVRLEGSLTDGRLTVAAGERRAELRLTAGLAWTLILPWQWPVLPWMQVVTVLFVAALVFPAAYWWRAVPAGDTAIRLAVGGAVIAWLIGPLVLSQRVPGAWDVAGVVLGALAGRATSRLLTPTLLRTHSPRHLQ